MSFFFHLITWLHGFYEPAMPGMLPDYFFDCILQARCIILRSTLYHNKLFFKINYHIIND